MPGLPQFRAFFLRGRPAEIVAAIVARDLFDQPDLLGDPRRRTVKLEEEGRRDFMIELRILVDRVHLRLVEELDARDRDTALDRQDYRVDPRRDRREGEGSGRNRLGDAVEPNRHFGDNAARRYRA